MFRRRHGDIPAPSEPPDLNGQRLPHCGQTPPFLPRAGYVRTKHQGVLGLDADERARRLVEFPAPLASFVGHEGDTG